MRCPPTALFFAPLVLAACAGNPDKQTLATLRSVEPDVTEVQIDDGLEQAMFGYQRYLEEAPESALTPEAMRRLADLKLEKEYGFLGGAAERAASGDPKVTSEEHDRETSATESLPAPAMTEVADGAHSSAEASSEVSPVASIADLSESQADFERRMGTAEEVTASSSNSELALPGGDAQASPTGPLEAIALYDRILAAYPDYPYNDQVLYQKARAFDELGRNDEAIAVIERLITQYPHSRYIDEVQFRRAEYFFTRRKYLDAEEAYAAVTRIGSGSQFYELSLYKLGWTLYKQEMHEEALDQYIALLDYKVSTGYDFDQSDDETDERRISDTYRVISLSFSNIGGSEAVESYFTAKGGRTYEDRIYSHLGEFYLEKLRYNDAAMSYKAFVGLHPLHRSSPHFGMRVVEIYEAGGFPKLVLESKKEFAAAYGLESEYWRHFDVTASPDVLDYLKGNLEDLANHYHAEYQAKDATDEKPENFAEALHWYRAYLGSFPVAPETPGINNQLADLLLENRDFGEAAREYERTAYDYPEHEKAAGAGYAAIYAHRQDQEVAVEARKHLVRREAVTSTLRFVDTFATHEHAAVVFGAAVDDLYDMKEYARAIETGQRLITEYPECDPAIRRAAWAAVAHSYFDTADYPQAEHAYGQVLDMTGVEEDTRQAVVDNLAAAIYKQGEQANLAQDYRAAADHFLRVKQAAPTSQIRPAAEYDAGAALIHLEEWMVAAAVLEAFREDHPDHELQREATKQIASVYRSDGNLARAAAEYERVAAESDDPELRREAMLLAGELYQESEVVERALAVYLAYVEAFPAPLETGVETRFKIAEIYEEAGEPKNRREQLRKIIALDARAGDARSDRIRFLAAQSALVLAEDRYQRFYEIQLSLPFDKHLKKKQKRMDEALAAFEKLLDYEVGEVTAASTFYLAEIYFEFSRALLESERPGDLSPSDLQDYEMVLEEEAYPFEERTIEVHEKNLELMSVGVYNRWIEKSLGKLANLMPGRYAKFEASSGLIASIDRYAYQLPSAPAAEMPEETLEGTIDEPTGPAAPAIEPDPAPKVETEDEAPTGENVAVS